ncbi:DNA-binding response regulator, LytR/AlgR family [Pedobacter steynii]|uniref:DNA-binding response regulator, LytR/AlgR family n=1 Tax=Pedobacter steynii TaxID=430522 RepID=A0A1G9Z9N7_9SPHI|nr:LytTR family DNA-binding domain-containing protein [Pedobacter steynii]NQX39980.1 LytTR family transcriptional regulator [Pedobacter steynii]SDN17531.1 DNA-binding response regulator, LytR/AlgR family [Pedobacter steynii]
MQLLKIQINRKDDHSGAPLLPVLLLLILGITGFTIFQDFLHSSYHNYAFYFSESLLFKSFWLLFLPLSFLQFQLLKRSVAYVPATLIPVILHVVAFAFSVWLLSALLFTHTYGFKDLIGYTLSEDSYKYVLIYGTIPFLYARQQTVAQKQKSFPTAPVKRITIGSARNHISIAVDEILYISSAAPYIAIRIQQKSHLHAESLKSIHKKLDQQQFIRIHKSTILNMEQVSSYKSRLNGDYDVLLKNGESLRLSRNYSAKFKELMG